MGTFRRLPLSDVLGPRGYIRGPFGSALVRAELQDHGIPVYEQQHAITGTRAFRYFIDEGKLSELARFQIHPNDLIVSCSGTVGSISVIQPDDPLGIISQALLILRPRTDLVLPEFLFYFLATSEGKHAITQASHGSVQVNIAPRAVVEQIEMPVPSLNEQRAIVDTLGAFDSKIELNRRMSQTLESMARALFKSWFVDFDPVRAKAEGRESGFPSHLAHLLPSSFADSELGEIPSDWRVCGLDEIADFLNGLALQRFPANIGRALPAIKIAQLHAGNAYGADQVSADIPSDYVIQDGDVLFSWSGSLAVELWCGGPGALNQHLFKVTSQHFPKWFYYHWTCRHLADFAEIAAGKATTMGHIQRGHLSAAKVVVPPASVLDAMTHAFQPLLDDLVATRLQSRKLAETEATLLPRLVSGDLDFANRG